MPAIDTVTVDQLREQLAQAEADGERFCAEIERLTAALKPFVDAADLLERNSYVEGSDLILRQNGVILGHAPVQTRDLIAAKRAYEQKEDTK